MADQLAVDHTHSTAVPEVPAQPSRTRTIHEIVEDVGHIRNMTRILENDAAETSRRVGRVHHQAFEAQLTDRARAIAKRPAAEMLDELADEGFAWRDIARLIGVSVPAVRKWRQGDTPTGAHLLAIARLIAFVETLRVDHFVTHVAVWMEMPLTPDAPLTGLDLAADGCYPDLIELATGHTTAEDLLDRLQPGWQDRYRSEFEVFEAADGELGIRFPRRTP